MPYKKHYTTLSLLRKSLTVCFAISAGGSLSLHAHPEHHHAHSSPSEALDDGSSTASRASDQLTEKQAAIALGKVLRPRSDERSTPRISRIIRKIVATELTARSLEELAWAYVDAARLHQDESLYAYAKLSAQIREALYGRAPDSQLLLGHVAIQHHDFARAEHIARRLVSTRGNPRDHALLGDALLEQGRLGEATSAYEQFHALNPSFESQTRLAWLNWLQGKVAQSAELWKTALEGAVTSAPAASSWAAANLGELHLQLGELELAEKYADYALRQRGSVAKAAFLKGRIVYAQGDLVESERLIKQSIDVEALPERVWWYADVLAAQGKDAEALDAQALITELGEEIDPRLTALYLTIEHGQHEQALKLAEKETERRSDATTLGILAFCHLQAQQPEKAWDTLLRARGSGLIEARLLLHSAAVAFGTGREEQAMEWAEQARRHRFALTPSENQLLSHLDAKTTLAAKARVSPSRLAAD